MVKEGVREGIGGGGGGGGGGGEGGEAEEGGREGEKGSHVIHNAQGIIFTLTALPE